jgi:hypothetical protein
MEGWSSIRFCSMKRKDSIAEVENEIHFQNRTRGSSRARMLTDDDASLHLVPTTPRHNSSTAHRFKKLPPGTRML